MGKLLRLEPGICKTEEGVAKNGEDGGVDPVDLGVMKGCA